MTSSTQTGNPFSLQGQRALITGSSGGIGFALARALGQAGASVVLNGRDEAKLRSAQQALRAEGLQVEIAAFDVTDSAAVRFGVAHIEQALGEIHILVNNAGMQIRNPLHEFADDDWHRLMRTNLDSVFFVSKAVVGGMIARGRGKIINICSVQSELGRPGIAPYTASKGAIKMLTKGMAIDLGPLASTSTAWARATSRPSSPPSWSTTPRSPPGWWAARPAGAGARWKNWAAPRCFWPARRRASSTAIFFTSTAA